MKPTTTKTRTCGTYRVICGNHFYLGSSTDIEGRRRDHLLRLKRGEHHSKKLQTAYNAVKPEGGYARGDYSIFELIERMEGATFEEIRAAEQELLDAHHGSEFCCNTSKTSIGATNPRPDAAARWRDPEVRKRMAEARKDYVPSDETRKRMGDAKRGGKNPHARPVVMCFKGGDLRFPCAKGAADHFGVSQQVMDAWLKGLFAWPGSGPRQCRKPMERLIGLYGWFEGEDRPDAPFPGSFDPKRRRVWAPWCEGQKIPPLDDDDTI